MKLQDRNLSIRMQGEDVALLQRELGQLINAGKLDIQIDQSEITREYFGTSTRQAVMAFQKQHGLTAAGAPPSGIVDEPTAEAINAQVDALQSKPFSVSGCVVKPDGTPIARYFVKAYDHDTCKAVELGNSNTDGKGYYKITYTSPQLSYEGKQHADLMVRVFESRTAEEAVVSSPLILNALAEEVVNLVVGEEAYHGPTEFSVVQNRLEDLQKIAPDDLSPHCVILMARKAKIAVGKAAFYIKAKKLEKATGIPSEVFYGLFVQQMSTALVVLVSQDMDVVKRALTGAIENNIISPGYRDRVPEIIKDLQVQKAQLSLRDDVTGGTDSLSELLNIAGLSRAKQLDFMTAYVLNDKPIQEFWQDLRDQSGFGDSVIDKLQLTIQLAAITRNHLPLVKALQAGNEIRQARDLAKFGMDDWYEMINDVGIPGDITGDTPEQQKRTYAQTLMHVVEDAFPTAVLANNMTRDPEFNHENFQVFFANNPKFDFSTTKVFDYLAHNDDALSGIEEPGKFTEELLAMQRIFAMSPKYEKYGVVKVLWQNKLHSAHAVARMGENTFISLYSQQFPDTKTVKEVYAKASKINSTSLIMLSIYNGSFNTPDLEVIPPQSPPDTVSNWENLFGSVDFCECKHCRSVLSPAAYLVDLLLFLDKSRAADGDSGLEKLFKRRPDIGNIALTCENTNTPMPYIDLVNEILESAIDPVQYVNHSTTHYYGTLTYPVGDVPQTGGKADQLKANPEHIKVQAYDILKKQVYPWSLPFNLWGEEAKVYLRHLGVPLHHLMEVFGKDGQSPFEVEIANCYLGMTHLEQRIIAGYEDLEYWEYFGLDSVNDLPKLQAVPTLLKATNLEYEELIEVLKTQFINPLQKQISFANDSCALKDAGLMLDQNELGKLHHFWRLKQKTGWTAVELDRVITALNPTGLDDNFVTQVYYIKRLQEQLPISLDRMLSWWALIDTSSYEGETSLYEQLFLNKTVNNPLIKAFELANLGSIGDTILNQDIAPIILSAINVNANDLALMVNRELPDDQLNLVNLSHLYRTASFSKALKINVTGYLTLKDLMGQKPLTEVNPPIKAEPKDTFTFLDTLNVLREAGFSIEELDYILRHISTITSAVPPSDQNIAVSLEELRTELQKVILEHSLEGELISESVRKNLILLLEADLVDAAIAIIDGTTSEPVSVQKTFIDDHFALFLDAGDAKSQLVEPGTLTDINLRFDYVLQALIDYFLQGAVIQKLTTVTGLEASVAESLLQRYLPHPDDTNLKAIAALLDDTYVNSDPGQDITRDQFEPQFKTYEHLYKIALLVGKLGIQSADLDFLCTKGPAQGWLDIRQLPLDSQSPDASFNAIIRLVRVYDIQHTLFKPAASVFHLLEDIDEGNIDYNGLIDSLSDVTGWAKTDIVFLTGVSGYDLVFPNDFKDERWLLKLRVAFAIIRKIGAPAEQIWSWHTFEIDFARATAIKNAVKAKYDNERWLKIAPPLRDALREKQRNALLSHVINAKKFDDANALYSYFLIDAEMNSCAVSSRIKQAISSVQLFVQRILMGLEDIPENGNLMRFPDGEIEYWQWMKYYRIWEANRKVFLYPENWIEPELRLEKSEFFQDMESQLFQGEINPDNLEQAYLGYLEKLDEVANLEINGVYQDEEQNILHVFGRTKGSPYFYYYRRWVCDSYWTPWEKVDLEIEGSHIIPVVYNRRLYLFWPRFIEASTEVHKEGQIPVKFLKIHLLYSQYQSDKWSSAKMSKEFITQERSDKWHYSTELFRKRSFFNPVIIDDELYIRFGYYIDWEHDWDYDTSGNIPPDSMFFDNVEYEGVDWPDIIDKVNRYYIVKQVFKLNNCSDELEVSHYFGDGKFDAKEYARPSNCIPEYMRFRGPISDIDQGLPQIILYKPPLELPVELGPLDPNLGVREIISYTVLEQVPEQFRIAYPHAYRNSEFFAQQPFFYQGRQRTFFILPSDRVFLYPLDVGTFVQSITDFLQNKNYTNFQFIDMINQSYWRLKGVKSVKHQPGKKLDHYFDVDMAKKAVSGALTAGSYYGSSQQQMVMDRKEAPLIRLGDFISFESPDNLSKVSPVEIGGIVTEQSKLKPEFKAPAYKKYYFKTFYHPYACNFIKVLKKEGLAGLLSPTPYSDGYYLVRQKHEIDYFYNTYKPTWRVVRDYPVDDIDFSFSGAYSIYNWELFFHAPLLIATRLSQHQKFEEAQKWFHYIFNPTEYKGNIPDRYWKIKPFYEMAKKAQEDIEKLLTNGNPQLDKQVAAWQEKPFQSHAIARLRITAYMKTVVMKYLDNLIAWGDHLFRRDTIESINEAAQLYILSGQILGRRPVTTEKKDSVPLTFNDLLTQFDILADQQINLEKSFSNTWNGCLDKASSGLSILNSILYFCVPHNKKLLTYWDTAADRLFKIRNCMNIEGIRRQLPLFEPPIDPGLLVKAVAAGADLSSILNDLYAPLPHYRFFYTLQKAMEMCSQVKSLGDALLSALEKRDSEQLTKLRAAHEVQLLTAAKNIKEQAIKEAQETLNALKLSKELANIRLKDYSKREKISSSEQSYLKHLKESNTALRGAHVADSMASIMHAIPNTSAGLAAAVTFGGSFLGAVSNAVAASYRHKSQNESFFASRASSVSSYDRRQEDWDLQIELASQELKQFDKQIAAAEIRVALAEKDRDNHEQQIANASEIEEVMKNKYTNQQLYDWLISQLSTLYFQGYQVAYDLAKRAEMSFRHELAIEDTNFIQLGYWDNLKKGLLAGERLHKDLKRMEVAYIEQNKREYELTRHISVAGLDPQALLQLREAGECMIDIPEILFDLDFPGQYLRRIKSVSLSIPCVTGPYTSVSCKLTLLANRIRKQTTTSGGYAYTGIEDDRFTHNLLGIQSIATSSAHKDSGLFQLDFRDERYLPFEGAGVISTWKLELPRDFRQFDYDTISDVIIHLNYTAREGGEIFKEAAKIYMQEGLNKVLDALAQTDTGLLRLFSLKQDYSNELHQFLYPPVEQDGQETTVIISKKHFPYYLKDKTLNLNDTQLILKLKDDFKNVLNVNNVNNVKLWIETGNNAEQQVDFTINTELGNMASAEFALNDILEPGMSTLKIKLAVKEDDIQIFPGELVLQEETHYRINREAVEDIYIIINYTLS